MPPIAGTLWQAAQLVPLNAGPSPSSAVSTSVKSSRPRRNSVNSLGVMPTSGSPGVDRRALSAGDQRRRDRGERPDSEAEPDPIKMRHRPVLLCVRAGTTSSPRMKLWPAPHMRVHSKV